MLFPCLMLATSVGQYIYLSHENGLTDIQKRSIGGTVPHPALYDKSLCRRGERQLYDALSRLVRCFEHNSYHCYCSPLVNLSASSGFRVGTEIRDTVHIDRCDDHRIRRALLGCCHRFPRVILHQKRMLAGAHAVLEPISGEACSKPRPLRSYPQDRRSRRYSSCFASRRVKPGPVRLLHS